MKILLFVVLNTTPYQVEKLSAEESYSKHSQNGKSLAIGKLTAQVLSDLKWFSTMVDSLQNSLVLTSTTVFIPVRWPQKPYYQIIARSNHNNQTNGESSTHCGSNEKDRIGSSFTYKC